MMNSHLNSHVARGTKGYEVFRVICNVNEQMRSPRVYMMDIQTSSARTFLGAAQSAGFVAGNNCPAYLPPPAAVLEPFAAFVIRVCWPNGGILRAGVRTKPPPALNGRGEGAELFSAMLALQFLGRDKRGIPAFPRTMPDGRTFVLKHCATDFARNWFSCVFQSVSGLAARITKPQYGFLLHNISRALKILSAMSASKSWAVDHRRRMAFFSAKNSLRKICLKLAVTLGTRLEQN